MESFSLPAFSFATFSIDTTGFLTLTMPGQSSQSGAGSAALDTPSQNTQGPFGYLNGDLQQRIAFGTGGYIMGQ